MRGGVVEGMYDSVLKRKTGEVNADKIGDRACSARQHTVLIRARRRDYHRCMQG